MPTKNQQGGCNVSDTFQTYISRDYLKGCSKLAECIDTLLESKDIKGKRISLIKACGLLYSPGKEHNSSLRGQCSGREKKLISWELEANLSQKFDNDNAWRNLKQCLDNKVSRNTRVEKICLMARNKSEICNTKNHGLLQNFLNAQVSSWRCACRSIPEPDQMSQGALVGIGMGCFLAIVAIFCILFFSLIGIFTKKKPKSRVLHVSDEREVARSKAVHDNRPSVFFQQRPSSLPDSMFSKSICFDLANQSKQSKAFMKHRPVPPIPHEVSRDFIKVPSRDSYLDVYDAESPYFEPISDPVVDRDVDVGGNLNSGYPEQTRINAPNGGHSESASSVVPSDGEMYATKVPPRPVPAQRIKKSGKKSEANYFELDPETTFS